MERKYGAVPLHSPTSDSNPNPAFSRCSKREATIPLGGYFSYQSVTYNTTANSIIYRNKTQLQISSRCANHKPALPAVSFLPTDHQGRRPLQRTRLTLSQPSPPGSDAASTSPGSWMSSQRLSGVNVHPSLPSTTSYTLPKPVLPKVCPYEQLRISSSGIQG